MFQCPRVLSFLKLTGKEIYSSRVPNNFRMNFYSNFGLTPIQFAKIYYYVAVRIEFTMSAVAETNFRKTLYQ